MAFQRAETIRCKIEITNTETGARTDPVTSTKITITDPAGEAALENSTPVTDKNMDHDGLGLYHYDFNPNVYDAGPPVVEDAELGKYLVRYTLDHDGIITIEDDSFVLEV